MHNQLVPVTPLPTVAPIPGMPRAKHQLGLGGGINWRAVLRIFREVQRSPCLLPRVWHAHSPNSVPPSLAASLLPLCASTNISMLQAVLSLSSTISTFSDGGLRRVPAWPPDLTSQSRNGSRSNGPRRRG